MSKSKILKASLGHLIVALSGETDRFVSNKQNVHRRDHRVFAAVNANEALRKQVLQQVEEQRERLNWPGDSRAEFAGDAPSRKEEKRGSS